MAQQVVQAPVGAKEDSVGYRWFPVSSQLIESLRFRFRHWTGCNCTFRPSGTTVVSFDRVPWLAPWARFLSPSGAKRQKKTWMKPFACQSQVLNSPGQPPPCSSAVCQCDLKRPLPVSSVPVLVLSEFVSIRVIRGQVEKPVRIPPRAAARPRWVHVPSDPLVGVTISTAAASPWW